LVIRAEQPPSGGSYSTRPNHKSPIANHKSFLVLDHLEKHFAGLHVTRDVSLSVAKSEIVALLGPSGSGKTTVLRLVAGFEAPGSGRVLVEDEDVTGLPPEKRRFGMVFQHYALFPHLTVGENVAFGLEAQKTARADVERRVAESLAAVDLEGFQRRRIGEISGGQQQRVALARALAPRPRVLLLDEPLSNLDPTLRERTRRELKRIIRRVGITTLFVTHEQEEAFDLGDRVAVLNGGRLEQVGPPEALYEEPATRFVATFIGRASVLEGAWIGRGGVRLAAGPVWRASGWEDLAEGTAVDVVVRPEGLVLAATPAPDGLAGEIASRRYAGRVALYDVALDAGGDIEVQASPDAARPGQRVWVALDPAGPLPRVYPKEKS
jgi:iron(III) transport system ATP-binding protein/putative spermidine/putrescine transport system ATP-binding protein/spermidine/putrescine transport system ATP-binding protein